MLRGAQKTGKVKPIRIANRAPLTALPSEISLSFTRYTDFKSIPCESLMLSDGGRALRQLRSPKPGRCTPCRLPFGLAQAATICRTPERRDRKSTRLNSSHLVISYAVFCLKKKKKNAQ